MAALRVLEAVANVAIGLTLLWPVRGRIAAILSSIPRPYAFLSVATSVTHGPIAALHIAWLLALFPSADAWSLRRGPRPSPSDHVYKAAILTATLLFLATYMLVGVRRVIEGGTEIFLDGSILRFLARNSISPSQLPQRLGLTVLEVPGLPMMFQVGFVLVTFFEITAGSCGMCR